MLVKLNMSSVFPYVCLFVWDLWMGEGTKFQMSFDYIIRYKTYVDGFILVMCNVYNTNWIKLGLFYYLKDTSASSDHLNNERYHMIA